MSKFPPCTSKEWCNALERLGFNRETGGKHVNKFVHPSRKTRDYKRQPNFIIIPHKIYPVMSKHIVKELSYFSFTEEEVKKVSK